METPTYQGACLCGAAEYEVTGQPAAFCIRHPCHDPYTSNRDIELVRFQKSKFTFLKGERLYEYREGVTYVYCVVCRMFIAAIADKEVAVCVNVFDLKHGHQAIQSIMEAQCDAQCTDCHLDRVFTIPPPI